MSNYTRNSICMQSNQHSGSNHLNIAIPISFLNCQVGIFSKKLALRWTFKIKEFSRNKNILLCRPKRNEQWCVSHLGTQNVLTRCFRDKQCFQHCRNSFKITSVSTHVEIFLQIFLFINALQAPTCWSCLKPEFMKLCRSLGEKHGYFNVSLRNVMVILIFPFEAAP